MPDPNAPYQDALTELLSGNGTITGGRLERNDDGSWIYTIRGTTGAPPLVRDELLDDRPADEPTLVGAR